jgi:sugar lactone lactonase YvrE
MFKYAPFVKAFAMAAGPLTICGALAAQTISLQRIDRISHLAPLTSTVPGSTATTTTGAQHVVAVAVAPSGAVYSVASESYATADYTAPTSTAVTNSRFLPEVTTSAPKTVGAKGSGPGQLNDPRGIAIDSRGNFYLADAGNNRIQKFSPDGTFAAIIGAPGSGKGELSHPYGVAVDKSGTLYVADTNNHRIVKFGADGAYLASWGTRGSNQGQFHFPQALAVDQLGNVYVADFANNRIQKFANDGTFLTAWGQAGSNPGQFNYPSSVAVDQHDHIWVTDLMNHRLEVFTSEGTLLSTIGSFGANAATSTEFNFPRSVAFAPNGDLWLAQPGAYAVDRYKVTEATTTASR